MNIRTKTQTVSCVVAFTLSFPAALRRIERVHEPPTVLVSVNTAGTAGGNYFDPVVSANGRFVAFVSFASDLVTNDTNDTNATLDIFVRDLKTGTTSLVSVNSAGTGSGNRASDLPAISADGRFVAFRSAASDLVANDTNRTFDVFVRDLKTGTTTLVSVNSAGTGSGNESSGSAIARGEEIAAPPVISADGRFVAFVSFARDLVDNDTNGNQSDVFVRDLKTGTTTLVSVNSAGTGSGGGTSYAPVISADGRFVAFLSNAADLVAADDSNVTFDVFVRDLKTRTTTLASVNSAGTRSGGGTAPVISADGRFVAFLSDASDLVANDINGAFTDVFVRDLRTGTTTLVSVNKAGTSSWAADSSAAAMSADGRFVTFVSDASDLVTIDTNRRQDVFVRDLQTGTTTLVSVNSVGTGSGDSLSFGPAISPDGRFVAFVSSASDLVTNDSNRTFDVFLRDLKTATTTLVSVNSAGIGGDRASGLLPAGDAFLIAVPAISADRRFVAFVSLASDLVANDTNGATDVFVRRIGKQRGKKGWL